MGRLLIAAAALAATAGPAASAVIGNTLQAAMDVRMTACTAGGQCQAQPAPISSINIYFSKNGNAYVYGSGRQGLEMPIGRYIANPQGGQQGVFVAGNRIDFKVATAGIMIGISFRVGGKSCTISGLSSSSPQVRITFAVAPKYCRIVPGRVER
jgi:hypothetical protein